MRLPKLDILSPVGLMLAQLFFYIPIKFTIIFLGLGKYSLDTFPSFYFASTLIVLQLIIWLFFFILIYNVKKQKMFKRLASLQPIEKKKISIVFSQLLIISGLLALFINIYLCGKMPFIHNPIEIKLALDKRPMLTTILSSYASSAIGVAAYFLFVRHYREKRSYLIILWLFGVSLLVFMLSGSRGAFIGFFLLPLIMVRHHFYKSISLFLFPILGVLGLAILAVLDVVRYGGIFSFTYGKFLSLGNLILLVLDRRFDAYFPNFFFYWENRDLFGFRYGFDYLVAPLQFVPRSFFEEKPYTLIREINNQLKLQSAGGTGGTSMIEAFANFGVLGLALNGFLGAYIVWIVFSRFKIAAFRGEAEKFAFWALFGSSLVNTFFISPGITHSFVSLSVGCFFLKLFTVAHKIVFSTRENNIY